MSPAPAQPRYAVVPRTLCFLFNGDDVLLMKRAAHKRLFPGMVNGVGGHVEQAERVDQAALREIEEETGLAVTDLQLAGLVHVDARLGQAEPLPNGERPGVMLFVFTAEAAGRQTRSSEEGELLWVPLDEVDALPWVDGHPGLLLRAVEARRSGRPFYWVRSE